MAPFKLKFRMGSSRSTSQEHDPDPQVNEALLTHHATAIGASSSTIDSTDCNSLGSMGNGSSSERKSLLPNKTNNLRLGYINQNITQCISESDTLPTTPPPSYEHVLEEDNRLSNNFERTHHRQLSIDSNNTQSQHSRRSSMSNSRNSANLSATLEELSLNVETCTDPDCQQNQHYNETQNQHNPNTGTDTGLGTDNDNDNDNESAIDQNTYAISTNMSAPSSRENLLEECTAENCSQYGDGAYSDDGRASGSGNHHGGNNSFYDPLLNHNQYYSEDDGNYANEHEQHHSPPDYMHEHNTSGGCSGGDNWNDHHQQQQQQEQSSSSHFRQQQHHHYCQQQYQQEQYEQEQQQQQRQQREDDTNTLTTEIMSNKSSKEIYKDLAKQWGITCKMSDGCRCMECQSHYFDCEFDDNEHQKTDGGLGAGTPMFISEVMHGSACNIL